MYLFIGNEKIIYSSDIVGVFDTDTSTVSPVTRKALREAQASGKLIVTTSEIPKSFILMNDGTVYMSQISPKILKKRAKKGSF